MSDEEDEFSSVSFHHTGRNLKRQTEANDIARHSPIEVGAMSFHASENHIAYFRVIFSFSIKTVRLKLYVFILKKKEHLN